MSESCETCRYMRLSNGTHNNAECHIGQPIIAYSNGRGIWPIVYPSDWCGEYQPKKVEEKRDE